MTTDHYPALDNSALSETKKAALHAYASILGGWQKKCQPKRNPANEEYADKQMNFGFTFGDEGITESYFYVTAYPMPDNMPTRPLPKDTVWQSIGFKGAVLLYKDLIKNNSDPENYLLELWRGLINAGRENMVEKTCLEII